jgi:hypothetical protein
MLELTHLYWVEITKFVLTPREITNLYWVEITKFVLTSKGDNRFVLGRNNHICNGSNG